jgi:phosphomannomutase
MQMHYVQVPYVAEKMQYIVAYLQQRQIEYITIDGIKLQNDDHWILIRKSQTEDIYRIFYQYKCKKVPGIVTYLLSLFSL